VLSTLRDEIGRARELGVAVGAFNVYNMEMAKGAIQAAASLSAPLFLQSNFANLEAAGSQSFVAYLKELAKEADVPAAIHLDHGKSVDEVAWAIDQGFTSVMFDGSSLAFDENIAITREVVRLARAAGVTVEGELGAVVGDEDRALEYVEHGATPQAFTDPDQAAHFVAATGVDILAVAVGNVHGHYRGEPNLDFERLRDIHRKTGVPLALHGASGLSAADLQQAARLGVVKVNFNTDLRQAYVDGMSAWLSEDEGQLDFAKLRMRLVEPVAEVVSQRLTWMGWRPGLFHSSA